MKNAFTLSEVLISLAIIGIVAALTMPALIQKYNEQETIIKLKKAQATFSQAYLMSTVENGTIDKWGISENVTMNRAEKSIEFFNKLKPYLKITQDCGFEKGCFFEGIYKRFNGSDYFTFMNATPIRYMVRLADGSTVAFIYNHNEGTDIPLEEPYYAGIYYDVNGIKPPNIFGKDLFQFDVTAKSVVPTGQSWASKEDVMKYCYKDGVSCAAWILNFGNMDYTHCKDLSWDGKHNCK